MKFKYKLVDKCIDESEDYCTNKSKFSMHIYTPNCVKLKILNNRREYNSTNISSVL